MAKGPRLEIVFANASASSEVFSKTDFEKAIKDRYSVGHVSMLQETAEDEDASEDN